MSKFSLGKNLEFDLNQLGIGQKLNAQDGTISNGQQASNLTYEEVSIFNVLDNDGPADGVLNKNEIDALKTKLNKYTSDGNFSRRDARKMAKEFGVDAKALVSFLQKLFGLSKNNIVVEDTDNTTTVTRDYDGLMETTDDRDVSVYDNKTGELKEFRQGNTTEFYENGVLVKKEFIRESDNAKIEQEFDGKDNIIGQTITFSDGRVIKKDALDRVIYEKDLNGKEVTCEYSEDGRVIKKDSLGRVVYDSDEIETHTFEYNEDGSVTESRYADKDMNNLFWIINKDSMDRTTHMKYFKAGNILEEESIHEYADNGSTTITIKDGNGNITSIINIDVHSDGSRTRTEKDSNGDVTSLTQYDKYNRITYSKGSEGIITYRYDETNRLVRASRRDKNYEIRLSRVNDEYSVNIKNIQTGKTYVYTFDNVHSYNELCANPYYKPTEEDTDAMYSYSEMRDMFFEALIKVPGEYLQNLAEENVLIYLADGSLDRSYMSNENTEEYMVIGVFEQDSKTIAHELGHIIDHVYPDNEIDGVFYSSNNEFVNAFNLGIARYEADGYTRHNEHTHWDPETMTRETVIEGSEGGNYGTWKPNELFTGILHYLRTGESDGGTSVEIINKYFPECRDLVKRDLNRILKGKFGKRSYN